MSWRLPLLLSSSKYLRSAPSTRPPPPPLFTSPQIPGRIDDPNYVRIFDTTLRDGEQSPGATLTSKEKLDIARQLSKLGVDIIEAGFPVASPDDFEAVRNIARVVGNEVHADGYVPVICGLSRTKLADLDCAWEAVKEAKLPRVHTFIATSEIHMKHKLRMTREQVIENAVTAVKHLRSLGCNDIEFSPEDAGRSDLEFLYQILGEVIKVCAAHAGAAASGACFRIQPWAPTQSRQTCTCMLTLLPTRVGPLLAPRGSNLLWVCLQSEHHACAR